MPVEEGLATSPSDLSSRLFTSITPLKPGSVFSCKPKYIPLLTDAFTGDFKFFYPMPKKSHPFFPPPFLLPKSNRGKPYVSVLRWRMESGIVGRQAGPLTMAWRVPTQRRCSPSSIYGTLLPGLAAYIACISKRWATTQRKPTVIFIVILYLFNSNSCQSEPAGFKAPPLIVDILFN